MNSVLSDDLTREDLTAETVKCLKEIFTNAQKVSALQIEILEINLSITAYVEESRKTLEGLRLDEANRATSSHQVVQILSDKCKETKMSSPTVNNRTYRMTKINQDNNNKAKHTERMNARSFITWYKHMIDNDRNNLGLYLSDDAMLEWFGRTVKSKKKVSAFFKYDMQCSRHDFTTVESIQKVELKSDKLERKENNDLANPINSPEIVRSGKRKLFQSCSSPEWAEGCGPPDEVKIKQTKKGHESLETQCNSRKRLFSDDETEVNSKGDGILRRSKRKCIRDSSVTPPCKELGQGDCLPSTSGTDSDRSHDTLNAQLPKLAVECNGYIEFTRSRNNRSLDTMKWERKCKVQISYSEDPLNIGEYVLWMIRYTDETKCRRNLLAAFDEVASESKIV